MKADVEASVCVYTVQGEKADSEAGAAAPRLAVHVHFFLCPVCGHPFRTENVRCQLWLIERFKTFLSPVSQFLTEVVAKCYVTVLYKLVRYL